MIEVINNLSDVSNLVMAITSVVNLIIVIVIFKIEKSESTKKSLYERKDSWYNVLGLKDLTISFSNNLNILKEESLKFFKKEISQTVYVKKYKDLDDQFLKYKNEYLTIVDCVDESLTGELTEKFQQIQDDLYDIVVLMFGDSKVKAKTNEQDIIIKFDNIRKRIIKMSVGINR